MASDRPQLPFRKKNRKRRGRPTYASAATRAKRATHGQHRWHLRTVRGVPSENCGFEKRRFCRDEKGRFKKGQKGCKLAYSNVAVCRGIWGRFEGLDGLEAPDLLEAAEPTSYKSLLWPAGILAGLAALLLYTQSARAETTWRVAYKKPGDELSFVEYYFAYDSAVARVDHLSAQGYLVKIEPGPSVEDPSVPNLLAQTQQKLQAAARA